MITPGFYGQPAARATSFEVPVVNGYTTARLRGQLQFNSGTQQVSTMGENLVQGVFANTGMVTGTIQLVQTQDPDSGPRANLGSPIVIVPGGRQTVTFTPTCNYLELACTGSGPTTIRAQLVSKIEYNLLAFAKTEAIYPSRLWDWGASV